MKPHVPPEHDAVAWATAVVQTLPHMPQSFTSVFSLVQAPEQHSWLAPHVAPSPTSVIWSTHVCTPVEQLVRPLWQILVGLQARPAVQASQVPLSHTKLLPHGVPLLTSVPRSSHAKTPDEQSVVPLWHGLDGGGHATPALHALHAPLSHTSLVPQVMPFAVLLPVPVSAHVDTPVVQVVVPRSQMLAGVHDRPAVHPAHVPLSQTSLVPHVVPFEMLVPRSVQAGTPVEQDVDPLWQALTGVHTAPVVHALHEPLSHTSLVPHVVPLTASLPVSVHVETPVEHDVVPVWHGLIGVHDTPAVQALHVPLSHTRLLPHVVPLAALLPESAQVDTPVEHDVEPVWQTLAGVHTTPAVHALHVPLSQTSLVPHEVPLPTRLPVSVHVDTPVEHEVVPVWHTLAGVHVRPAVHALQEPLSHTSLVPHEVPLPTLLPVSVHVDTPVEHEVEPVWHGLAGVHATPAVHEVHVPLSHTSLVPHVVPLVTLLPVSLQSDTPVEHDVVPAWHGLVGVHTTPAVHALHVPLSHTSLVPHVVPLATLLPVSVHTDTPVEHDVVPVWHTFAGVHARPDVHALHDPLSHTWLLPHVVPLVALLPLSLQTDTPVEHEVVPVWHAFAGVHAAPVVQALHEPLSHTLLLPHVAPLARSVPRSVHVETPVEHEVVPLWQELVGVHDRPAVHALQVPLSHTSLVPQLVPLVALVPRSAQVMVGEQLICPLWQTLVGVQGLPAVHAVHVPVSQTPLGHVVPLGTLPVAPHRDTPVEHEVTPVWQGLAGEHVVPAVHVVQVPLSQTSLVPHVVPLVRLLPESVHTGAPVVQDVVPVWHTLVGVHDAPEVHAPQDPLSQTSLVPHDEPLATCVPVSVHTATPVEHDVTPVSQGLGGVHASPEVHPLHAPLSHTSLVPQVAPLLRLLPVSLHTGTPVVHDVVPVWHGLVGVHDAPVVQALHVPALHTSLVPHVVPFETLVPVSVHTGVPVVHDVVPVWHTLVGVHAAPTVHAWHDPLSHTSLVPQLAPLATLVPVSVHTDVPVEHDVTPVSQGLGGVHEVPAVHALHTPLLHTLLAPQLEPSARSLPVSVHTGMPVVQEIVPVWHGFDGGHEPPDVHAPQTPLSHTEVPPQLVPFGTGIIASLHTGTPVEHVVVPRSHALTGTQKAPTVHPLHEPLSHTAFVPHMVPLATCELDSLHTATPVVQSVVPVSHGLAGVQAAPWLHALHVPLSHTMPVPHEAPLARCVPVSVHTAAPVVHEIVPVSQLLVGVQDAPAMHATHAPVLQTLPAPHVAPFATAVPVSLHTETPVVHDVTPVSHGLVGVHATPAVHPEQTPLSQTWLAPHAAPFATDVPVSLHTATPVVQTMLPVWHWLAGVQLVPVVHAVHEPLSHTWLVPHVVPFVTAVPVSVHTPTPVVHTMLPTSQGLGGVHEAPALHAAHVPLSQTWPVPHVVPLAALFAVPVSVHTGLPVVQLVLPAWQGFVGVQLAPVVQPTHAPLSQTWLVPHEVPLATFVFVSVHTAVPVEQLVVPRSQGLVGVHDAPVVHAAQAPLSQTSLVPHTVPLAACVPVSVHVGVPPEQLSVPVSHALVGVHDAPAVHAVHAPLWQTELAPQDVPLGTALFVLAQTEAPVEQTVCQTVHEFVGEHTVPAVHAVQAAPRQTMFVPHVVPSASAVPVSLHTATPVEQSVVPVSHTLVGVQASPCVHAAHVPLPQTWLAPHVVPLATFVLVSRHVCTPPAQSVTPAWQTLVGEHPAPEVHAMQAPWSHAMPVPHAVPLGAGMRVSMHSGAPIVMQSRMPRSQALAGAQDAPATHGMLASAAIPSLWVPSATPVSTLPVSSSPDSERASMPLSVVTSAPLVSVAGPSVAASVPDALPSPPESSGTGRSCRPARLVHAEASTGNRIAGSPLE